MKKQSLVLAIFALFSTGAAFAAADGSQSDARSGIWGVYDSYSDIRSDLDNGLVSNVAKKGLDIMVAQGVERLRDAGEIDLADQYQREWTQQISVSLSSHLSSFELGDFDPLSPWLDGFYNTLYKKTHGIVKGIRVVHDIYKANFALAVVLKPNGKWRKNTDYDRIEYRKHFIPFADIMTYWVTLEACNYYLSKYDNFCGDAADLLEHYMGRWVAPRLSDSVFAMTCQKPNPEAQSVLSENHNAFEDTYSRSDFENDVLSKIQNSNGKAE